MSERIVVGGLARLADGGIEHITMQGLASDLGYAVGALYRYFRGKDELLLAMQRFVLDGIRRDLAAVQPAAHARRLRDEKTGDRELCVLSSAFHTYASVAVRRPEQFALLSLSLGDPRPLVEDAHAKREMVPALVELLAEVSALFDAAASAGALDAGPGAARAIVTWSALHGVLSTKKLARFDLPGLDPDALVVELLVTLLAGWGAPRERVRALQSVARDVVRRTLATKESES